MNRKFAWLMSLFCAAAFGCAANAFGSQESAKPEANTRVIQNLQVYDYACAAVKLLFYDETFHGLDWQALGLSYRAEAATASDDDALYAVLRKLCGELKESHLSPLSPRQARVYVRQEQASVGMRLVRMGNQLVIVDVQPDGPAARGGIKPGWILVSRNGQPFERDPSYVNRLNQRVTYGFVDAEREAHQIDLMPAMLNPLRRVAHDLPGDIRYLRFDQFDADSVHWASAELKHHRHAPAIVIDLRFNRGGHAEDCVAMIQEFFDHRVDVGRVIDRSQKSHALRGQSFFSASYGGKVVVLIGGMSASSAEIFAHVLQHDHRATLAGQRSAGAVQAARVVELPGGGALEIPVGDYIGLDGQRLEGRGVTPDLALPALSLADLRAQRDPEVEAAVALLKN